MVFFPSLLLSNAPKLRIEFFEFHRKKLCQHKQPITTIELYRILYYFYSLRFSKLNVLNIYKKRSSSHNKKAMIYNRERERERFFSYKIVGQ